MALINPRFVLGHKKVGSIIRSYRAGTSQTDSVEVPLRFRVLSCLVGRLQPGVCSLS